MRVAVRFLDNIIDLSRYPLEAQRQEAMAKRRIELGVTGLGDALIFCGARYDSRAWDAGWDGGWHVVATRYDDGWAAIAVIPFETLGLSSPPRAPWRMNFFRTRHNVTKEQSAWRVDQHGGRAEDLLGTVTFGG